MARQSDVTLRATSRRKETPSKVDPERDAELPDEVFGRRKPPEIGRFRLQVDRQTKGSYATHEAALEAAHAIKRAFPIVHVAIVDAEAGQTEMIALPAQ
jgi:hypothetical protein